MPIMIEEETKKQNLPVGEQVAQLVRQRCEREGVTDPRVIQRRITRTLEMMAELFETFGAIMDHR